MFISIMLMSTIAMAGSSLQGYPIYNETTAYNYHSRIGIPEATRIKEYEEREKAFRIIGGWPAIPLMYPYQAGLIINFSNNNMTSICGASLLSQTRLVTAGHCWNDGEMQAKQFEVVLGTTLLFYGGTRIKTDKVIVHEKYHPDIVVNDIAIINIPRIEYTLNIKNIALPGKTVINESFVNHSAWASGFGKTSDSDMFVNSVMKQVNVQVIPNKECRNTYKIIKDSHICTSGAGVVGTCGGDSGGPLATKWNGELILIGVTSFGSTHCEKGLPSAYARVTSYLGWIKQHL